MRSVYINALRTTVVGVLLIVAVQVMLQTRQPMWVEDTYEIGPSDCDQAPVTGRMRFNVCANLDTSRMMTTR